METETIILIGPEGAGKSTLGKALASRLSKELYSLDRHRDELYAPYNYDKSVAEAIYDKHGIWAFYQHWSKFEYKATCRILENAREPGDEFYGKILDFGAGHSVYEVEEELAAVEKLMQPYKNVFLLLPCEDAEEALKIMEQRRGHELELNRHFVEHKSNRMLAKHIVYTEGSNAEECADQMLEKMQVTKSSRREVVESAVE